MLPMATGAPIIANRQLNRRHILRGSGAVALGLPFLEIMGPSLGCQVLAQQPSEVVPPRRFVAVCATLGFHTPFLFPSQEGLDYESTPYLKILDEHRGLFTAISGLSHPNQQGNNGHASELTWLTSAERPGLAGFRNSISIDQRIAQEIGTLTRYPSLCLSTSGRSISWTAGGVEIPGMTSPAKLFTALFIDGNEKQVHAEVQRIQRGRSILDTVRTRGRELHANLGRRDQHKMDEYLTAIRDLEFRLQQSESWVRKPKPHVDAALPVDVANRNDAIAKQNLMYDMIALALQTDSTRTITFQLSGMNAVPVVPGVNSDWHNLSHHGKDPDKIDELAIVETAEITAFSRFLKKLRSTREDGNTLLDNTAIMFGSNLGNASAHDWRNLPLLFAGGNVQHRGYVAHDPSNNTPLANAFVSIAQFMGVNIERFGSSTQTGIEGLDLS